MFSYYLDLAFRSLRRNVALTALMVVAIAFGIGASMTTLTVLHVLSVDPIPSKSHDLYNVQLDPRPARGATAGEEPALQLTLADAEALLRAGRADRQVMMSGGNAAIEPERAGMSPFFVDARYATADFFAMFEAPFAAGAGWNADDDARAARVAVIASELADKLFGSTAVVGRTIRVGGNDLRIVGVLESWRPEPHYFDLTTATFGSTEQLYVPFRTSRELKFSRSGNVSCWAPNDDSSVLGAPCHWIQFWVEVRGKDRAATYRDFLVHYSEEQRAAGRYERPPNVRMRDVTAWLDFKEVVPGDAQLQSVIALGFLVVCLVNTVGLLLTKFLRRSMEIGVRRALGASKRSIFVQLLIEAGAIGVAGGVLGLGLAALGLWAIRHQPTSYAKLAQLDLPMLAATFAIAVLASLLAGLLPAWRGCQVTPAIQLKSH